VTPVPVTVGVGRTAILLVTVREASGFNEPVQLSCSGLPTEAACSFVQSPIPAGGGSTTLYLSTAAPRACGSTTPYFVGSAVTPSARAAILLACLAILPLYRRRRLLTRAILVSIVALSGLAALSGCGNCTDLGTRPAVYTFTVTAAAQGATAAVQSQPIQLTVTIP